MSPPPLPYSFISFAKRSRALLTRSYVSKIGLCKNILRSLSERRLPYPKTTVIYERCSQVMTISRERRDKETHSKGFYKRVSLILRDIKEEAGPNIFKDSRSGFLLVFNCIRPGKHDFWTFSDVFKSEFGYQSPGLQILYTIQYTTRHDSQLCCVV